MQPDLLSHFTRYYHDTLSFQASLFVHEPEDECARESVRAHYHEVHSLLEAVVWMTRALAEDAEASDGSPEEVGRLVARARLISPCVEFIQAEVNRIGPARALPEHER